MEDTRFARPVVSKLSVPIPLRPETKRSICLLIGSKFLTACVAFAPPRREILFTRLARLSKLKATLPTVFISAINAFSKVDICGKFVSACVAFAPPSLVTEFTIFVRLSALNVICPSPVMLVANDVIAVAVLSSPCAFTAASLSRPLATRLKSAALVLELKSCMEFAS